jgi:hypothetical protein
MYKSLIFLFCFSLYAQEINKMGFVEILGQSGGVGFNFEKKYDNWKVRYGISTAILAFGIPIGIDYCFGAADQIMTGISVIPSVLIFPMFGETNFIPFLGVSGNIAYRHVFLNDKFLQFSFNPSHIKIFGQGKGIITNYHIIPWFGIGIGWKIRGGGYL